MSLLITNIGELVTNAPDAGGARPAGPGPFAAIADAALVVEDSRVAWTGPAARAPAADHIADCGGRAVLPGFVDSHAHLVFDGERSAEFAARMAGTPYGAGGIKSTVAATRKASDARLRANARRLAGEMLRQGTTTLECKSGYGLTVDDERRSVAAAAGITDEVTFLGAHVVPPEFEADPGAYCRHARRKPGGSTCSANGKRSARTRRVPSWRPGGQQGCRRECMPTSWARDRGCSSRWRWVPPLRTTAPT